MWTISGPCRCCRPCAPRQGLPVGAPAISVVLPVPGDVRGLPAGTQFQRDAVTAGEAIIVNGGPSSPAVGLVPDFEYPTTPTATTNPKEAECAA